MSLNDLVLASLSSIFYPSGDWHIFQLGVSLCVLCIVICLSRVFFGEDLGGLTQVNSLLLFFIFSAPLIKMSRNKEPTVCSKKRSKAKKDEPPTTSEPTKRKPLKEKRKRRKITDKVNKDSPKVDVYRGQVTKMYSTLDLYEKIKGEHLLDDKDLYYEFLHYTLTPKQLAKNGFPLDCPENPGKVISLCKKFRQDPTSRTCSRCHGKFHITEDDRYISDTVCYYHTARCDAGFHACCNKAYGSEGCILHPYHVTSELFLDDVIFKRIEGKRQIREDQSCKVYALDCEMLFTTIGMEVAKIGLVDLEGKTVYQTFVLPEHPILDYNTQFSGIDEKDLLGVNITLADVQTFLLRTLNKKTILVGHALQNDLRVLRLIHENIVDTQVVFHQGNYRKKLKTLAQDYLQKSIQDSADGHDSIEDARACMELMLWKIKSDLITRPPAQNENKNSFLQNTSPPYNPLQNPEEFEFQPISASIRHTNRPVFNLYSNIDTKNSIKIMPQRCNKYITPSLIICRNCTPRSSYICHLGQLFVTEYCELCDP